MTVCSGCGRELCSQSNFKIVCGKAGKRRDSIVGIVINPLALELDIYSLAHHLCKM